MICTRLHTATSSLKRVDILITYPVFELQLRIAEPPFSTFTGDGDVSIIEKVGLQAEVKSDRKTIEIIGKHHHMFFFKHSNNN